MADETLGMTSEGIGEIFEGDSASAGKVLTLVSLLY
jgi:hypothetical protein